MITSHAHFLRNEEAAHRCDMMRIFEVMKNNVGL
jgi:hypothetical protein